MRVFKIMGNYRLYKTEYLHSLGTPESEQLKVTALNLFHPTTPPSFKKSNSLILRYGLWREEMGGWGKVTG
jgi:hypothetical protein